MLSDWLIYKAPIKLSYIVYKVGIKMFGKENTMPTYLDFRDTMQFARDKKEDE
jgi:hypothetical protein